MISRLVPVREKNVPLPDESNDNDNLGSDSDDPDYLPQVIKRHRRNVSGKIYFV